MHLAENSFDVPAMGKQHSSQKKTAPAHSFGSCSRDRQQQKLFMSEEHERRKATMASPGPVYSVPSAVGEGPKAGFGTSPQRQHGRAQYPDSSVDVTGATVDSQNCKFPSTKGVHFGTDLKDNMKNSVLIRTHPQANMGMESPGPFAYDPKDRDVTRIKEPRYSLGQKTKILATHAQTPRNVGPGSYPPTASMGEQPKSEKRSNPSFSFGNEKRMPALKKSDAVLDPHPDIGSLSSFGRQVVSNQKSSPGYGFGTATRDHKAKTFLVQTGLDKGPKHEWGPTPQDHPRLPKEKEMVKYS
jgi:hypothetical protein